MQDTCPSSEEYVPGAHALHKEPFEAEVPAGHLTQAFGSLLLVVGLYCPGEQAAAILPVAADVEHELTSVQIWNVSVETTGISLSVNP